jgi:hypothetical protein
MLPCPCTPGPWPPGTEPRPGPTPPAPFRLSGRRQLRAHAPYAPSARLRARTRYVPGTARLRARRTAALRRGCPFRFPRLRRADRWALRGQGCLSLRSLSRGYGFAYTGGGCRPPGPPPGHAPQLARLHEREAPLNSPTCGRAPLRGRRRCAPHAPSAPSRRIRAPSPPKSPPLHRQRPAGPPSSHPRDRGTSHNGRALCAAPSAASGRSPRCRPSWLTYPVRRSSGGVEARPNTESAGIPAAGLAKRRFETRGLPFCFGRPPAPPPRAGRVPSSAPAGATSGSRTGAGWPPADSAAGRGSAPGRRCGNPAPGRLGGRRPSTMSGGKRPSRWLPAARLLRRPHHAARERRGIMGRRPRSSRRRVMRALRGGASASRSPRRSPPETRSGLARRTSSPARTPLCGGPWPGRPAVRARDIGPASASRFPVSLASSAGSRGAVAHSKKPRPCFGLPRSQASATPSPGLVSSRRRHGGATQKRAAQVGRARNDRGRRRPAAPASRRRTGSLPRSRSARPHTAVDSAAGCGSAPGTGAG